MNTVINYVTKGVTEYFGWWADQAKAAYNYAESFVVAPVKTAKPKRKSAKARRRK